MEKMYNDFNLKDLGIGLSKSNIKPLSIKELSSLINESCYKFCKSESTPSIIYFIDFLVSAKKIELGEDQTALDDFFCQIFISCKEHYKSSKEMKLFLKLMEKSQYSNKKSCKCYMKARRFFQQSQKEETNHGKPLSDYIISLELLKGLAEKLDLDFKALQKELLENFKADFSELKGPEVALAVLKVFNMSSKEDNSKETPLTKVKEQSNSGGYASLPEYKKLDHIQNLLNQKADSDLQEIESCLFKLFSDPKFKEGLLQVDSHYETHFSKYLKIQIEKASKSICGVLSGESKNKEEEKQTVERAVRFLHGYSKNQIGRLEMMSTQGFDSLAQKRFHEICISVYSCEYVKKNYMKIYSREYGEPSEELLKEKFSKPSNVDQIVKEKVLDVIEWKLYTFIVKCGKRSSSFC